MRGTRKYPRELLEELLEYIDKHPGVSTEELLALIEPYFARWYNPDRARRNAQTRYLDGALKQMGKEKGRRDVLSFFKHIAGKKRRAHAVVATASRLEILYAQREALAIQREGIARTERWVESCIEYLERIGVPRGVVEDGEVVERVT